MFRRLLLLVMSINFMSGLTFNTIACDWDLNPSILLITSYNFAQNQVSTDQLIYKQLKDIYGSRAVTATFSYQDDNSYAIILRNLIESYHLNKVFILDPSFVNYLPSTSVNPIKTTNLIRIMQQFTNVKFYFFNNQIANNIKVSSNIFEFRLDTANNNIINPIPYGQQISKYFYNSITQSSKIDPKKREINTDKYKFDTDAGGNWLVKIGVINNIGNKYQQNIIEEFKEGLSLAENNPPNTTYLIYEINVINPTVIYDQKTVNLVEQASINLYSVDKVNFIFNANSWYNNAIDYAASYVANLPKYSKTISFIAQSIIDNKTFFVNNRDYLLFAYNIDWSFLNYTKTPSIPDGLKVLSGSVESDNAYGINSNLDFIDGF